MNPVARPKSRLAREAADFVRGVESELLYHHSLRVYAFAALQGNRRGLSYDAELVYIAALFHDIGLVEGHRSAHDRFEVDGANAARSLLAGHGITGDTPSDPLGRDRAACDARHPAAQGARGGG